MMKKFNITTTKPEKNHSTGGQKPISIADQIIPADSTTTLRTEQEDIYQRHIGICNCWNELEKRRKALDLFIQRQLEVNNGVPQKIFYECGITPKCPYLCVAIQCEESGKFEIFEQGHHSHPVRSAASSVFLVDEPENTNNISTNNLTTTRKNLVPISSSESRTPIPEIHSTTIKQRHNLKSNSLPQKSSAKHETIHQLSKSPEPKRLKRTRTRKVLRRDSSTETDQTEDSLDSKTNSYLPQRKNPHRVVKSDGIRSEIEMIDLTSPALNLRSRKLCRKKIQNSIDSTDKTPIKDKNNKSLSKERLKNFKTPEKKFPANTSVSKGNSSSQKNSPGKGVRLEKGVEWLKKSAVVFPVFNDDTPASSKSAIHSIVTSKQKQSGSKTSPKNNGTPSSWQFQKTILCDNDGLKKFCLEEYPEMRAKSNAYWMCNKADDPDVRCKFSILVQSSGTNRADQKSSKQIYTRYKHNHELTASDQNVSAKQDENLNTDKEKLNNSNNECNVIIPTQSQQKITTPQSTSPILCPTMWNFTIEHAWPALQQIANELLIAISKDGLMVKIFSNDIESEPGQYLMLTDVNGENNTSGIGSHIQVNCFVENKSIGQEQWPKAHLNQFLYAVRGKCMEFFFKSPLETSLSSVEDSANPRSPTLLSPDNNCTHNANVRMTATPEIDEPAPSISSQSSTSDSMQTSAGTSAVEMPILSAIKREMDEIDALELSRVEQLSDITDRENHTKNDGHNGGNKNNSLGQQNTNLR